MSNTKYITIHRSKCGRWVNEVFPIETFTKEDALSVIDAYHDGDVHGTISNFVDKDGNNYRIHFWVDFAINQLDVDIVRDDGVIIENLESTMILEPGIYNDEVVFSPLIGIYHALVDEYIESGVDDYFSNVEEECISLMIRFMKDSVLLWENI